MAESQNSFGQDIPREPAAPEDAGTRDRGGPPDSVPASESPQTLGHWLCSELVKVCWRDATGHPVEQVANLEEIWQDGATLDAEEAIPEGIALRLQRAAGDTPEHSPSGGRFAFHHHQELQATVSSCGRSATGYAVSIRFEAGSEWNPRSFPPAHALNAAEFGEAREQPPQKACAATAQGSDEDHSHYGPGQQAVEQGSLYCLAVHAARS